MWLVYTRGVLWLRAAEDMLRFTAVKTSPQTRFHLNLTDVAKAVCSGWLKNCRFQCYRNVSALEALIGLSFYRFNTTIQTQSSYVFCKQKTIFP